MQTEAVFENIANRIEQEISKAQKCVYIAVAWFTNKRLFNELVTRAKNGCSVYLIVSNDSINLNSSINFEQLNTRNSRVYKVGNGYTDLMHNKFCVIDYSLVITGSYNWSYKAENNFENIIINCDDTALAQQFISEFNSIRKQYYPDDIREEITFPLNKIIKRLEILKNYILLEDIDELKKETAKLSGYGFNSALVSIIDDVNKEEFASAINKIKIFIESNQQLTSWIDPEIAALKLEIRNLENKLNAYDNERIELEKQLSEFQHRHTIELGDLILEILKLRKIKFKDDNLRYEEADNDEKQYQQQVEIEKVKEIFDLTDEQKKDIKKKFHKATFLCHPDKVSEEFKDVAQSIFIELKAAYDANDLKKITEILGELEKGNYLKSKSETVTELDILKAAINKLRRKISIIEEEIIGLKQNETYKTVSSIDNWDKYFNDIKHKLEMELDTLKHEIQ